jgi:hypothetical protein
MNVITFRYLISLPIQNHLFFAVDGCRDWILVWVIKFKYIYIYMKVPDEIPVLNMHINRNMYCVKLVKSLYDLKQLKKNVVQPIKIVPPKQMLF